MLCYSWLATVATCTCVCNVVSCIVYIDYNVVHTSLLTLCDIIIILYNSRNLIFNQFVRKLKLFCDVQSCSTGVLMTYMYMYLLCLRQ